MLMQAKPLIEHVSRIFMKMGSDADEAKLVADSLVRANLMGHDSHGVGLVATYIEHFKAGLLKPGTSSKLVKDDGAILMFDGCRGFGRRVGGEAMTAAVERCKDTGVVLLTLRNAHHLGRIGAYGEIIMGEGFISLNFANVTDHEPSVVPWGGTNSRFVTNPVCVAVPGTEKTPPTLLDMATSKIAIGKARVAMSKGVELEPGMVVDNSGKPTTDPSVMYRDPKGSLLPFGEHKGSGIALMCELLAGGLSGGGTIQPQNPRFGSIVNNLFTIVVDPVRLVDVEWLRAEIDATIAYVKSTPSLLNERPVLVAGDAERLIEGSRSVLGIEINDEAWQEMESAAARLN